jgi:hypothetical protein
MIPDEYERTEKDIAKVQLQRVLMLTSRLSLGAFSARLRKLLRLMFKVVNLIMSTQRCPKCRVKIRPRKAADEAETEIMINEQA